MLQKMVTAAKICQNLSYIITQESLKKGVYVYP